MVKSKVHRIRADCRHDMLKEVQKHITTASLVYSEEEVDWTGKRPKVIGEIFEFNIQGMRVKIHLSFPDNCTICGCSERRLDQKYGRDW